MFEKCPKCGNWTVSLNRADGELECLRNDCGYREKVNVDAYLRSKYEKTRCQFEDGVDCLLTSDWARARMVLCNCNRQ